MPFMCRKSLLPAVRFATMAFVVLVVSHAAVALDPKKSIGQFIHQTWQTEDGLPDSSVTAILQTREGYLVFGTHRGLVRFDGVRFTVFNRRNFPEIAADSIDALCEDSSGTLWAGTAAGLHRIDGGRLGAGRRIITLGPVNVQSIAADPAGGIWFGTAEFGAGRVVNGEVSPLTTREGLSSDLVRALCVDRAGSVWIGTFGGGLNRFRDGQVTVLTSRDGLPSDNVQCVYEDRAGTLWIGTDGGLSQLRDGRITSLTTADGLTDNSVRAVTEDRDGNLWVATFKGLNRYQGGRFSSFTSAAGLTNDVVLSVFEDREGGLWIGTEGGGLNRLKDGMITAYTTADGLSNDLICPILEDRDRNLWIGTYGGGLNRMRDGVVTRFTTREGLSSDNLNSLYQDRNGTIWVGTIGGGLCRLDGGRFTVFTERDGLTNNNVHAIAESADGELWVGTDRGITRIRDGRMTPLTRAQGLSGDTIRVLLPESDGSMWVGTNEGLSRIGSEGIATYRAADGLPSDVVWSLYLDASGSLWIGTAEGLARLSGGQMATWSVDDGLFDNDIYQILEDDSENLWMSCTKGIFRVAKRQLDEFAGGSIPRLSCASYGRADGMRSEVCTHFFQPAGWKAADGRLWFPTTKGAVVVDAGHLSASAGPPPVIIEDVIVDGVALDTAAPAELAPGRERLEIHFTGLSFFAPETIRFRYRLEGFDDDWVDAGTERVAYFTNLNPGEYTFRVIASSGNGEWGEESASFRFVLKASPLETWWAMALYACAALGLVYAGVRLRLRSLERSNRALEEKVAKRTAQLAETVQQVTASEARAHASEIRAVEASHAKSTFLSNISHELRTPLTAILGFVQLIARDKSLSEAHQSRLAIVLRSGEHLHSLINDVLSLSKIEAGQMTLNERAFDLHGLLESVVEMMRGRSARTGVDVNFELDGSVPRYVLGDEGKLRQILINLLGNSLKFTENGRVTLRASWADGRARFEVEDTGIGIANDEIGSVFETFYQTESGRQTRQGSGLGLAICRNFVRLMGGEIEVSSELGKGSIFRFEIDLPETSEVEPASDSHRAARLAPGQERFRVLVVDDDAETRALFGDILRPAGFEVIEAADGIEGVQSWLDTRPHLVCMDIRMPEMDGYAATRRIRELEGEDRRTVILGLSASALKHERDAILEAGGDGFVSKPFRDADVLDRIAGYLGATLVYDDSVDCGEPGAMVVTASRLAALDPVLRGRLKEAAVRGSVQAAMSAIDEVRNLDVELAGGLAALVDRLALDELVRLIERADDGADG